MSELYILNSCKIENCEVLIDNVELLRKDGSTKEFLSELYRLLKTDYPKFFKMDTLSKAATLAADLLLKGISTIDKEQLSIVMCNSCASLSTDIKFQESIDNEYFPSPALFVYTLPNISIGEICIKHKIYGENYFFISPTFDIKLIHGLAHSLFENEEQKYALMGWVDDESDRLQLLFVLVSREKTKCKFELQTINDLLVWKN